MTWAYARFEVDDPIETIVLITLANYADDFGACWPSQATLARDCRCKIRKLQYSLKALEERGLVARHARRRANGSRRSDVFVLIGFERRERAASLDDHPVFADLNRATADASETTIRTSCRLTGRRTCRLPRRMSCRELLHLMHPARRYLHKM